MVFRATRLAGALFALTSGGAVACDFDYVVQADDTLNAISATAYKASGAQLILARNQNLAGSITALPVGEKIVIPCIVGAAEFQPDGEALTARMAGVRPEPVAPAPPAATEAAAPTDADAVEAAEANSEQSPETEATAVIPPPPVAEAPAAAPLEAAAETPQAVAEGPAASAAEGPFRLLTATGQPPFADEDGVAGGLITEMLTAALASLKSPRAAEIVFINDREEHLRALLVEGSFHVGFPWARPDCGALAEGDADAAWFCEKFHFSAPVYEYVNSMFVNADGPFARRKAFADFSESRICRPGAAPMDDLIARGVAEPDASFVRRETAASCFTLLTDGEVDAVNMEVFEADAAIAELGIQDEVAELAELGQVQTLHAVAPKSKPDAVALVRETDLAIEAMKTSGEWFHLVSRHLPGD